MHTAGGSPVSLPRRFCDRTRRTCARPRLCWPSGAKLLRGLDIAHTKGEPFTHERLGRLDRFHPTLRRMIGDLFAATDSHVWFPYLQDIIMNYNTRPHRGLKPAGLRPSTLARRGRGPAPT